MFGLGPKLTNGRAAVSSISLSFFFYFGVAICRLHFKGVQGVAVSARLRVLSSAVEACTR